MARFAETYADQNERDYAALKSAVDSGRVGCGVRVVVEDARQAPSAGRPRQRRRLSVALTLQRKLELAGDLAKVQPLLQRLHLMEKPKKRFGGRRHSRE